jgi:hypothetical protein
MEVEETGEEEFVNVLPPESSSSPKASPAVVNEDHVENKHDLDSIDFRGDWSGDLIMPPCAERTMSLLLKYLDCLKSKRPIPHPEYERILNESFPGEDEPLQLRMANCLVYQMEREKFPDFHVSTIKRTESLIQKGDLADASGSVRAVLKDTRVFDIDVALRIIEECSRNTECLRGKEVVLLMGATGSGMVHFRGVHFY